MTDTNNTDGAAILPVTAEDVEAALATFDGGLVRQNDERNARGYTTFYHPKDSMRAVLEEFSARQSSSNAGGVDEPGEPVAYLHTLHMEGGQSYDRLTVFNGIDPDDDRVTAFGIPGRDYSEEYSVSTTPLYALTTPPTPDRIGKDAVREALGEAFDFLGGCDGASEIRGKILRALSAAPAQPVDETERLRAAIIKRRDSEVAEEKACYAEGRPWKAHRYAAQILTELLGEAK